MSLKESLKLRLLFELLKKH